MAFTIDQQSIQLINMFERMTRAKVRDAFDNDDQVTFVVEQGELPKALGKQAGNVRKAEQQLKRKVKVVEYNDDMEQLIRNITPAKNFEIKVRDGIVTLMPYDLKVRGVLIGRAANRLRAMERIVQRYHPAIKRMVVTNVQEAAYTPPEGEN